MSQEVADRVTDALWKLEEDQDVEALVQVHTEDCSVGNVAVAGTFSGHDGLREFWTSYRKTFDEMKSEFRNIIATDDKAALEWTTNAISNGDSVEYDGVSILDDRGQQGQAFDGLLRSPRADRADRGLERPYPRQRPEA